MAQLVDRVASLDIASWLLLLIAPFIGSFLGVVIRRLPCGRPLVWTGSGCEVCGAALTARDLVPLVSWFLARGRCRHCGQPIGWFYPGIELAAFAVAAIAIVTRDVDQAWFDCLLGWWLLTLGWIDLCTWMLPDTLTLPLLVLGLAAAVSIDPDDLADHAAASMIGYGALRAVAWTYHCLRRREGLGGGDAKLLATGGAWLGIAALPQILFIAAAAALVAAAGLVFAERQLRADTALPFGPFLALAIWLVWLFGPLRL